MELTHAQFRDIMHQLWPDVGELSDEELRADMDEWVNDEDDDLEVQEEEEEW